MEKEDGEVVDVFQNQEYYPSSDSFSNEQKQLTSERENKRSEDRWRINIEAGKVDNILSNQRDACVHVCQYLE